MDNNVYVLNINSDSKYPNSHYNFSPGIRYPEYPFKNISKCNNEIYSTIREIFRMKRLDSDNYGTNKWNPLGDYISPGQKVLIKPNMVLHENKVDSLECMITNPSLVRAVLDYVVIALKGNGYIIVADAPMQSCDYEQLLENNGYYKIIDFYKNAGIDIEFKDLRNIKTHYENGVLIKDELQIENKSCIVDLNGESYHAKNNSKNFRSYRITNYDPDIMGKHHNNNSHEYLIAQDVLDADVIINMPKPKCHRKAGVTIALKNIVGINTNKEWLPHHTFGSKQEGGDEYLTSNMCKKNVSKMLDYRNRYINQHKFFQAKLLRYFIAIASRLSKLSTKDNYREGSWWGNDTIWRTILDLNTILLYCDKNGNLNKNIQRKVISIADMVISGEKEGPLLPTAKNVGIIVFAENSVAMDEAIATLMGFDYNKIPTIKNARNDKKYELINHKRTKIISNNLNWNEKYIDEINRKECFDFEPSSGWKGYLDKNSNV